MPATLPKTRSYPLFEFQAEDDDGHTQQNTHLPDSRGGRLGSSCSDMMCTNASGRDSHSHNLDATVAPPVVDPSARQQLPQSTRRRLVRPRSSYASSSSSLSPDVVAIGQDSISSSDLSPPTETSFQDDTVTYTLYLIRHGEATHNVLEKAAKDRALIQARMEGLPDHHPETKRRLEAARVSVLDDVTLIDAPLSEAGIQEALRAREDLLALSTPPPTQVLVSPLHRTLQTADLMFPDHPDISVWNGCRERQTGFPPDRRATKQELIRRSQEVKSNMPRTISCGAQDMDDGQPSTMLQDDLDPFPFPFFDPNDEDESSDESGPDCCLHSPLTADTNKRLFQNECIMHHHTQRCSSADPDNDTLPGHPIFIAENRGMLRLRTHKLLDLLADQAVANSPHRSVALVTHKGYIRELERGPLGHPEATECGNCEIRVYRVTLRLDDGNDSLLESAERII